MGRDGTWVYLGDRGRAIVVRAAQLLDFLALVELVHLGVVVLGHIQFCCRRQLSSEVPVHSQPGLALVQVALCVVTKRGQK